MFALIPQLLMRAGWPVTPRGGVPGAWSVCLQGLEFPTPGVVFVVWIALILLLPCVHEPPRPSDGHGIRHEGPDCSR